MSKYDKTIAISREEEGTYHRREYEHSPARPVTTYHTETIRAPTHQSSRTVSKKIDTSDDEDNFEEWTTSKRKVNHKTRQVETRVSRQLLVEDGKVIADSGPQVTTRIKEDNKVEECEKEKTPKNKSRFEALENAPECDSASGRVLGEKKEIQRVSREVREENMQYHDERFKELTGHDVHRKAIKAPHELITINDKHTSSHDSAPRGKMVHYSNKGKKYQDTDEILEVAKLAIDGSITKEVKRTKHHEEFSEDEKPDEKGEAEKLRQKPIAEKSSRRHFDYVNDFDDTATPSGSEDDERDTTRRHGGGSPKTQRRHHTKTSRGKSHPDPSVFPRYDDPLVNSLRDEDFRPQTTRQDQGRVHVEQSSGRSGGRSYARKEYSSSDDDEDRAREQARSSRNEHRYRTVVAPISRSPSPVTHHRSGERVEIPEQYRTSGQKLTSSNRTAGGGSRTSVRERSFSPQQSRLSHKSNKSHRSHKEDASVQARLTDEEVERRSLHSNSSGAVNSHETKTKHLQRQSSANSSRNYYFGESRQRHRKTSITSTSSASSIDPKEAMRKNGTKSRDSGFRSPHGGRHEAVSPTPSAGQRSVKTTTTTMSAGLADRPLSRASSRPERPTRQHKTSTRTVTPTPAIKSSKTGKNKQNHNYEQSDDDQASIITVEPNIQPFDRMGRRRSFDNISVASSLGPNATTIKVPYRPRVEVEPAREANVNELYATVKKEPKQIKKQDPDSIIKEASSEMSFQEDIQSLSKRLESISSAKENNDKSTKQHFDYKTIIENIQPIPAPQVVGAYNVRIIQHTSPFMQPQLALKTQDDQTVKQANQMLLSNEQLAPNKTNYNESDSETSQYAKYRAVPVLVDGDSSSNMDFDRMSLGSSCSLQSFKTYNIRPVEAASETKNCPNINLTETHQLPANLEKQIRKPDQTDTNSACATVDSGLDSQQDETNQRDNEDQQQQQQRLPFVEDIGADSKRPAAWFFDARDGSSTEIVAPAKPKDETPKVDSRTEELVQSRGGRSYYLELVEPLDKSGQRHSSIDSLYSRWNSQGAINSSNIFNEHSHARYSSRQVFNKPLQHRLDSEISKSRPIVSANLIATGTSDNKKQKSATLASGTQQTTNNANNNFNYNKSQFNLRKQLPFSGPPSSLGNRSKSSSCLLTVTRPSKYSIYGGFRKPGDNNKPVPRLSYSRAIGPKSQRQIDAQPKTPSRYLKMK